MTNKKTRKQHQMSLGREVIVYGIVGIMALLAQDVCYILITKLPFARCNYSYCILIQNYLALIAMFIGNLIGMFISFIGHTNFTFKKKKSYKKFIKFAITSITGLSFNLSATYLLINILKLNSHIGLIPTFLAPIITYLISKFWVFK